MSITATELKNNLGKYLLLSAKEDVFITKNGKIVAKLTNPHQDRVEVAKSLFGILPKDADLNEAKEERLGAKQMRVLADTNVIIDALTSREPWNKSAEEIFLMAANHTIEMYITASSATDIYYLIRKHLHNIEAAKMIMGKLYSLTGILEVTADDCMDALASAISDYEDAVVEKVASRKDMDYIVTRNIKDYQAGGTKIILPDDFVKLVEEE